MTWPPFIRTRSPGKVISVLRQACGHCQDWEATPEDGHGVFAKGMSLAANYTGKGFAGEQLRLCAIACLDTSNRVQITMHAHRWSADGSLPSDDGYATAEALSKTLLDAAGELLGRPLRLSYPPPHRTRPLRGALATALGYVTGVYEITLDPARPVQALHPLDQERFRHFIRTAHSYRSSLRPRDVAAHLTAAGFGPELVSRLQREYELGRQVLADHDEPWELRRIRRAERRQRLALFKAERELHMREQNARILKTRPISRSHEGLH